MPGTACHLTSTLLLASRARIQQSVFPYFPFVASGTRYVIKHYIRFVSAIIYCTPVGFSFFTDFLGIIGSCSTNRFHVGRLHVYLISMKRRATVHVNVGDMAISFGNAC